MAIEEQIVRVYNKILAGRNINEIIGDWHISNLNCASLVELWYKADAIYGFDVGVKNGYVQFYNYHREVRVTRKGIGTITLMQLESSFRQLAKDRNQNVIAAFALCNQKDTENWLKKNKYIIGEKGDYYKLFEV